MQGDSAKKLLLDFIDFLRFKVVNERLTYEEVESLAKTFQANLNLTGTADDFAEFYGKTKTNVTTVIDRKMSTKPKRAVLYSLRNFERWFLLLGLTSKGMSFSGLKKCCDSFPISADNEHLCVGGRVSTTEIIH